MRLIQVFEPPMCCSTGVCGPEIDPVLVQFAADLDALRSSEVKVKRFNLSQSPNQFATTPAVLALLREQAVGAGSPPGCPPLRERGHAGAGSSCGSGVRSPLGCPLLRRGIAQTIEIELLAPCVHRQNTAK